MMKAVGVLTTCEPVNGVIINPHGIEIGPNIPILDSHNLRNGALGYLERAWVEDGLLMGELQFTGRAGRRVYKLIERGSLNGVSCRFEEMRVGIYDADGRQLDIEEAAERGADDPDLFVIAETSLLTEVSITSVPADRGAFVRACSERAVCWSVIRDGEEVLQRILHSDGDGVSGDMRQGGVYRRVQMPPPIQYSPPESVR